MTQVGAGWSSPPACFCRGTRVKTPQGYQLVQDLRVGDAVMTASNGPQILRWIGVQKIDFETQSPDHMPIEFKPNSLAPGLPSRVLAVSPHHRMVLETDEGPALGPAKGFLALRGVRQRQSVKRCVYFALLLDRHEVIFAENTPTESFLPGPQGLRGFSAEDCRQIERIYPGLSDAGRSTFSKARFAF